MKTLPIKASFDFIPAGTKLPDAFTIAGFKFSALSYGNDLSVSGDKGELGLRLREEGVGVALPVVMPVVHARLCCLAGPMSIETLDARGHILATMPIDDNHFRTYRIDVDGIAALRFTGGNNEALLSIVQIEISTPD